MAGSIPDQLLIQLDKASITRFHTPADPPHQGDGFVAGTQVSVLRSEMKLNTNDQVASLNTYITIPPQLSAVSFDFQYFHLL
jgi:hypothetical protein